MLYVSNKNFVTKGLYNDKEIMAYIIPGLTFSIVSEQGDLVKLENIDTKSVIILTKDMLYSELFIKK